MLQTTAKREKKKVQPEKLSRILEGNQPPSIPGKSHQMYALSDDEDSTELSSKADKKSENDEQKDKVMVKTTDYSQPKIEDKNIGPADYNPNDALIKKYLKGA